MLSSISIDWFAGIVLPLMIFLSRVVDVSMSTIRIMFVWAGNKWFATLLGFFEALIWIVAIGQIMKDITNVYSYVAYAGGFATGTYLGMYIEQRLAFGKVVVRVITKRKASELILFLKNSNFGVTSLEAEGHESKVNIIYTIIQRSQLEKVVGIIKNYNPRAFYTIENVRYVSEIQEKGTPEIRPFFLTKRK
ncbi:MAG: DUF2179 domain-containing protein [Cytophagaceae bacterium]